MRTARPGLTFGLVLGIAFALAACQVPYTGSARATSPSAIPTHWLRAAPTPVVRQHRETDCGLAALAMVAGRWGKQWRVDELVRHAPPDKTGIRLGALRDLARKRGLDAYVIRGTVADITHELRAGRPVLVGLSLPFGDDRIRQHFEVAVAIDPQTGTVVTLDPASGQWMRRTRAALEAEWKPEFPALVVVGELTATANQ